MRMHLAAAAARIMAEEGIDDFALAKRKALRRLGADEREPLPANEEIEAELRDYLALYRRITAAGGPVLRPGKPAVPVLLSA